MGLFDLFRNTKGSLPIDSNEPKEGSPIKYKRTSYNSDDLNETKTALEEVMIPFIGEAGKKRDEDVIRQCKDSTHPLDKLAMGFAYVHKGADFRKDAIACINEFLDSSTEIPRKKNTYDIDGQNAALVSKWHLFSTLSALYEKEYDWDNAILCLKKCQQYSKGENLADYTRVGDILVKKDVNLAVEYYESLKNTDIYNKKQALFDGKYKETLEKQRKGYKFKPRNK